VTVVGEFASIKPYLVGIVGSGSSTLAFLTRGKLGEVTVVVTLPVDLNKLGQLLDAKKIKCVAISPPLGKSTHGAKWV
jgi:hypothetical protein